MKKTLFALLTLTSFSAHSALFQGTSSGNFVNPTGPLGFISTGAGTNQFTWGTGVTGSPPSSLGYAGRKFDIDENSAFIFGTISYFNGEIEGSSGATSVDLNAGLDFASPFAKKESFTFNLGLINTPNTADPNASADIVNFDNKVPSNFFSFNGTDFTLEFLGFGTLTGAGFTLEDSFRVLEGESASVDLIGRITSNPVPVPAAVWLFGSGLIALITIRRRHQP
ncbi:hypothetical protein MNBD_GAMMA10-1985 [hydrothermal vent metagenome]|uniref:PEP-CTERM protein-sorting domain-containing protein n=1 Tax=hydrothermal vent metagenome TaxID=652676 RepID=A0A3B0XTK7_9ZZZZ